MEYFPEQNYKITESITYIPTIYRSYSTIFRIPPNVNQLVRREGIIEKVGGSGGADTGGKRCEGDLREDEMDTGDGKHSIHII